jgi:hypothetical protein
MYDNTSYFFFISQFFKTLDIFIPLFTIYSLNSYSFSTGRVLVYGGYSKDDIMLASVEMLQLDGHSWQTQPTPMFAADAFDASVSLQ